jgi:hypothetical protein
MGVEEEVKLEGVADAGVDHSACTALAASSASRQAAFEQPA